ncbi:MAG: CHAT domain-containing protein [Phormidesmis sp.]
MSKTVVINLGKGTLGQGFPHITARLWTQADPRAEQFVGSLSPAPALVDIYRIWQSTYRALSNRLVLRSPDSAATKAVDDELEIDPGGITQVSQQSFEEYSQQLKQAMNTWLASPGLLPIERQLRSHLAPTDEIRVIFETDNALLLRLPWHCWDFFKDYPHAEMALSRPEYKRLGTIRPRPGRKQVRILAIVGDSPAQLHPRSGIDIDPERRSLQALPDAEVKFLVAPSRQAFNHHLWDAAGWDLLFFAGHSQTESQTGRLYFNEGKIHNSLTIEQLEEALKIAIANGLQLAIFNSCDGVGLAQSLGKLQIPQVIFMREPVPNRVAQTFLQYFLAGFATERLPLYQAMRQARGRLQGLEDEFPGASWLPVLCQNPAVEPIAWAQMGGIPACPYRGLAAFQESDTHLFFGREQVTKDLLAAVQRPFVAVTGPSGSGKSSVVYAGLVPWLKRSGDQNWKIVSCRPGSRPFDNLAEALITDWHPQNSEHCRLQVLELAVCFQQNPQALCEAVAQHQIPGTRQLLIIDQFEELYTLCSEADRQPFLDLLLDAVNAAPAFTLLITLRADFYGWALSDRRFSDALHMGGYNLGPMTHAELARAIAEPARQMQIALEPGLTDKLIQATANNAGRLPLLEFALSELWSQQQNGCLTHEAYQTIGGVEKALANHAEAIYSQFALAEQRQMQRVFMQLIEPGAGSEATRRVANRDEVGETWDLVSRLASARLVVTSQNPVTGKEAVEIIHEALIRGWGRLTRWLQVDGEFRRWQEDLRQARGQWENSEREEAALLRGKQLINAKDWYDARQDELSLADRQFVQSSLLAQEQVTKRERRRQYLTFAGLCMGMFITLSLSGVAWWGSQRARLSEVEAIATASDSLLISNQRLDALVASLRAQRKLESVRWPWPHPEMPAEVESVLRQALSRADEKNRLLGHTAGTTAVAFSHDGLIVSAGQDGTVKLWQPDGTLSKNLNAHSAEIWGLAISPDGQTIASASDDKTVKLWRRDGTPLATLTGHGDAINAVAFSADGQQLTAADQGGIVTLWQQDGTLLRTFRAHNDKIDAIAFSPDDQYIATASGDSTIKLWNLSVASQDSPQQILEGHEGAVRDLVFSPDGDTLASAGADHTIRLWNLESASHQTLAGHTNTVYDIDFSSDGQLIASASDDKTVRLWQREGHLQATFRGHSNGVTGVAFSPDGQTIASASFDSTIRLWQKDNPLLTTLAGHSATVRDVAFSPDGQVIASASDDNTVRLWQPDGVLLKTFAKQSNTVYSVAFSPDGQTIASGNKDGTVTFQNRAGALQAAFTEHRGWVTSVAFSPDGQLIATGSDDHTIKLWKPTGALVTTLTEHQDGVTKVAFSPDGQLLASASDDHTVRLWQRDGTPIATLTGHSAAVKGVSFSPDGQLIASASSDNTVRLWRQDGQLLAELPGHRDAVVNVAFSPDGLQLASSSVDKTVKLWDKSGTLLKTLSGYKEGVIGIAFSPDGKKLAATSVDRTITLWDLNAALNPTTMAALGCSWIQNYLETNPLLSPSDRKICP